MATVGSSATVATGIPVVRTAPHTAPGEQRIILHAVGWDKYLALGAALGEKAGVRTAFLDGELEIMTVSRQHEHAKKLLARLLEAYAEESGVSLNGFGNETFRARLKQVGIEPDECYCIGAEKRVPDIAIEIALTSGGVDKLEIYRRLGVSEVWFWADRAIQVYRLRNHRYLRSASSRHLPEIDVNDITAIVLETDRSQQTEAVRNFRQTLRSPSSPRSRRRPNR